MQNVDVSGENYEVTGTNAHLATALGYFRMFFFVFLFFGDMIINSLGNAPDILHDLNGAVKDNKL